METEAVASAEWEEFIEYFGDTQWHLDWVQSALEKVDTTKLRKFPGNFATAFGPNGKNTAGSGDCVGYEGKKSKNDCMYQSSMNYRIPNEMSIGPKCSILQ